MSPSSWDKGNFVNAIDRFTKWVEAKPLTKETGNTVTFFLRQEVIFRHGCPKKQLTDIILATQTSSFLEISSIGGGLRQYLIAT